MSSGQGWDRREEGCGAGLAEGVPPGASSSLRKCTGWHTGKKPMSPWRVFKLGAMLYIWGREA